MRTADVSAPLTATLSWIARAIACAPKERVIKSETVSASPSHQVVNLTLTVLWIDSATLAMVLALILVPSKFAERMHTVLP